MPTSYLDEVIAGAGSDEEPGAQRNYLDEVINGPGAGEPYVARQAPAEGLLTETGKALASGVVRSGAGRLVGVGARALGVEPATEYQLPHAWQRVLAGLTEMGLDIPTLFLPGSVAARAAIEATLAATGIALTPAAVATAAAALGFGTAGATKAALGEAAKPSMTPAEPPAFPGDTGTPARPETFGETSSRIAGAASQAFWQQGAAGAALGAAGSVPNAVLRNLLELGAITAIPPATEGHLPSMDDLLQGGVTLGALKLGFWLAGLRFPGAATPEAPPEPPAAPGPAEPPSGTLGGGPEATPPPPPPGAEPGARGRPRPGPAPGAEAPPPPGPEPSAAPAGGQTAGKAWWASYISPEAYEFLSNAPDEVLQSQRAKYAGRPASRRGTDWSAYVRVIDEILGQRRAQGGGPTEGPARATTIEPPDRTVLEGLDAAALQNLINPGGRFTQPGYEPHAAMVAEILARRAPPRAAPPPPSEGPQPAAAAPGRHLVLDLDGNPFPGTEAGFPSRQAAETAARAAGLDPGAYNLGVQPRPAPRRAPPPPQAEARPQPEPAAAPAPEPAPEPAPAEPPLRPGQVMLRPDEIQADPERLQYKVASKGEAGTTGTFKRGQEYNPAKDAEGILVWRDPANQQVYVVDGHNRLASAQRQGLPAIKARVLEAPDAESARALGAIENLTRNNGTPKDAAAFFQEHNLDAAKLQALGVDTTIPVVRDGLALASKAEAPRRSPSPPPVADTAGDLEFYRQALAAAEARPMEGWRDAAQREEQLFVLRRNVRLLEGMMAQPKAVPRTHTESAPAETPPAAVVGPAGRSAPNRARLRTILEPPVAAAPGPPAPAAPAAAPEAARPAEPSQHFPWEVERGQRGSVLVRFPDEESRNLFASPVRSSGRELDRVQAYRARIKSAVRNLPEHSTFDAPSAVGWMPPAASERPAPKRRAPLIEKPDPELAAALGDLRARIEAGEPARILRTETLGKATGWAKGTYPEWMREISGGQKGGDRKKALQAIEDALEGRDTVGARAAKDVALREQGAGRLPSSHYAQQQREHEAMQAEIARSRAAPPPAPKALPSYQPTVGDEVETPLGKGKIVELSPFGDFDVDIPGLGVHTFMVEELGDGPMLAMASTMGGSPRARGLVLLSAVRTLQDRLALAPLVGDAGHRAFSSLEQAPPDLARRLASSTAVREVTRVVQEHFDRLQAFLAGQSPLYGKAQFLGPALTDAYYGVNLKPVLTGAETGSGWIAVNFHAPAYELLTRPGVSEAAAAVLYGDQVADTVLHELTHEEAPDDQSPAFEAALDRNRARAATLVAELARALEEAVRANAYAALRRLATDAARLRAVGVYGPFHGTDVALFLHRALGPRGLQPHGLPGGGQAELPLGVREPGHGRGPPTGPHPPGAGAGAPGGRGPGEGLRPVREPVAGAHPGEPAALPERPAARLDPLDAFRRKAAAIAGEFDPASPFRTYIGDVAAFLAGDRAEPPRPPKAASWMLDAVHEVLGDAARAAAAGEPPPIPPATGLAAEWFPGGVERAYLTYHRGWANDAWAKEARAATQPRDVTPDQLDWLGLSPDDLALSRIGDAMMRRIGTREELYQSYYGREKGAKLFHQEVAYRIRRDMGETDLSILVGRVLADPGWFGRLAKLPYVGERGAAKTLNLLRRTRWGERFGVAGSEMARLSDAVEAIKELDGQGNPVFGTKRFPRKPDGSYKVDPRTGQPAWVWRFTAEQGAQLWAGLSPRAQDAAKWWVVEREQVKRLFGIVANIEGYLHHWYADSVLDGFRRMRLARKKASPERLRLDERDDYVKDFERSVLKGVNDLQGARAWNGFIRRFALGATEPGPGQGVPLHEGWEEIPRTTAGRGKVLGQMAGGRQIPKAFYDEFVRYVEDATEVSATGELLRGLMFMLKANLLTRPGTAARNFYSGGIQYATKIVDDLYRTVGSALLQASGLRVGASASTHARRFVADLLAPADALRPSSVVNITPELYHAGGNILQEFQPRRIRGTGAYAHAIGAGMNRLLALDHLALWHYQKIENYWKRVLTIAAARGSGRPLDAHALAASNQALRELYEAVDVFAYDYWNTPRALKTFRGSAVGAGIFPYPTYGYKSARMYSRYFNWWQPGLDPEVRLARILTAGTIVTIALLASEWGIEKGKELARWAGMPSVVDKAGRLYLWTTQAGKQRWLDVSGLPWFNVAQMIQNGGEVLGDAWRQGPGVVAQEHAWDVAQRGLGQLGGGGPMTALSDILSGKGDQFSFYTPNAVRWANLLREFVPLSPVWQGLKRTSGGPSVQPSDFLQAFVEATPIPGGWVAFDPGRLSKDPVTRKPIIRDPTLEQLKFWAGLNILEIDPAEYDRAARQELARSAQAIGEAKDYQAFDRGVARLRAIDPKRFAERADWLAQRRIRLTTRQADLLRHLEAPAPSDESAAAAGE